MCCLLSLAGGITKCSMKSSSAPVIGEGLLKPSPTFYCAHYARARVHAYTISLIWKRWLLRSSKLTFFRTMAHLMLWRGFHSSFFHWSVRMFKIHCGRNCLWQCVLYPVFSAEVCFRDSIPLFHPANGWIYSLLFMPIKITDWLRLAYPRQRSLCPSTLKTSSQTIVVGPSHHKLGKRIKQLTLHPSCFLYNLLLASLWK